MSHLTSAREFGALYVSVGTVNVALWEVPE